MSETDDPSSGNLASHTLAFLRRIDKRLDGLEKTMIEVVDLLSRQATKVDRSDRDTKEGFARIERSLLEIKSDAILSENKILDRFSDALEWSRRLDRHDERLERIEIPLSSPPL